MLLVAAALLPAPSAAAALGQYVYYFARFGQWSVLCALDEPTGLRQCRILAPPPRFHEPRAEIEVRAGGSGGLIVTARRLFAVNAEAPVYLRIDAGPPHQARPQVDGAAAWRGGEAAAIVEEMRSGRAVVVRWFVGRLGRPRDVQYPLARFAEALAAFRGEQR